MRKLAYQAPHRLCCIGVTGVPLRDMIAACTVGYLESTPLLDLNHLEEAGDGATLTLAAHVNLGAIPLLQLDDKLPMEMLETASCVMTSRVGTTSCSSSCYST
jgi:ribonuclease PH